MTLTRRQVIAVSTVLLLVFVVGVFFLVRLGMAASSNAGVPAVASSTALPPTGDNGLTTADGLSAGGEGGDSESGTDRSPTVTAGPGPVGEGGHPPPGTGSSPTVVGSPDPGSAGGHAESGTDRSPTIKGDTRTDNGGAQPPRPAVMLSDSEWLYVPIFSGDGNPVVLKEGEIGNVSIHQGFQPSIPARVIDVSISTYEPGNALLLAPPILGEGVKECGPGVTAEPTGYLSYLCTVGIRMSESAEPGVRYEGRVGLVFEATCTARTGYPCESLPENYVPSPDNPIDVTFIADGPLIFEKEA